MFSKSSKLSSQDELQRTKDELARAKRRAQLLEQRLRNNQQVFVDFESIAQAVGRLIDSKDSECAVRDTLSLIGEGSGLDRIYILKNAQSGSQEAVVDQLYTWVREDAAVPTPDFQSLPYGVFFPNWISKLPQGERLYGSIKQAPEIEFLTLEKQNVVSYLWIPLFLDNKWWGIMGFDQVIEERTWHQKEISGYGLLATSVMEFLGRQELAKNLRIFQERYDMASRAGQFGVWDWSIQHNQVYLDPSIKNIAGYSNQELEDNLENWETIFALERDVKWIEELNRRIVNREKDFEIEHWIRHVNGQLVGAYSRGKIVYDDTGTAVRVLGTTTDITHLKSIQNDLRKARDLAEEGSRSKSEFMAKMSHEIRTPLNGVLGFATLLKHTSLDSEQEGYLKNLETSCKILLSMVNNILDFSKIEAGKLDLERKPFFIRDSIETILQVFGDSVVSKGLKLKFAADDNLPLCVLADPLRVQQIILNLIGNAVKFTEEGSIEISASWTETQPGKGRLRLTVADTGIGIETDRLNAIFEPFTQADSSMTRRFGGSGLGLTICQNILQVMGSSLEVSSKVGQGSKFSFELLVEEVPEDEIEDLEPQLVTVSNVSSGEEPEVSAERKAKVKILLAEDNQLNQQVVSKLLNRLGYNAVLVEDGQEAVDALNRWDFDLVFMDLMMPNLDGVSATKIIRDTLPPAKQPVIVALTANTSEDDINNCMAVGMNDFLSKPVELSVLEKTLNQHLDLTSDSDPIEPKGDSSNTIHFQSIQEAADSTQDEEGKSFSHFDPQFMRNLMGSNSEPEVQDEFSIDAIEIFLETTGELVDSFRVHYDAKNWKAFERAAHSLKGTAKTVGALILGNKALELELWVKEGHSGKKDKEIQRLEKEYQALAKELTRYRTILKDKQRQIS